MADTKLSALTLGTIPKYVYGIDASNNSRKYNALVEHKNVLDFGAFRDGTNASTTTAAIQAAVDLASSPYSSANRATIYFPVGTYLINAPITFETVDINIRFLGEPGATITGNFADALLKRSVNSPISGVHSIESLRFVNTHASGIGILAHSCVGIGVRDCYINCWRGIETYNSQDATLDTCTFIAPLASATSVGIMAGNATTVLNCDVSGYSEGIRHQNLGLVVLGGRYEVNVVGILIGKDESGSAFQSNGFHISGLSMESNDWGIYILAGGAGMIAACAVTSNFDGNHAGIYMADAEEVAGTGIAVSNSFDFTDAGIYLSNPQRVSFDAVRINVASGAAWRLPTNGTLASCDFRATTPRVDTAVSMADMATYGTDLPIGTPRRISNSNVTTGKITGTGANNVLAVVTGGGALLALGVGS